MAGKEERGCASWRFATQGRAADNQCMDFHEAATLDEMRQNLTALDRGPLGDAEMARLRRIGDHINGRPRAV